ncbi:MAG: Hpt domain-containing protein [Gammaproteobacteria bacterium]|nr:Hpt domain-containing protein [Gammaproteobacteria bacterium]
MSSIDVNLLGQLKELIGGDQSELNELINTFLSEANDIVSDMNSSLDTQNLEVLRRSGHSLKSSAQDFGATELSALSASLESACRSSWPDDSNLQVERIQSELVLAQQELQSYLQNN